MNYFEFYGGDYLRDTSRLSLTEHGAYLKLMIAYYGEEQALPADYSELYTIAVAISPADQAAVRKVADKFFPVAEDGLRHKNRIDEEIAKARKRIDSARANGGKGGRPPKTQQEPSGKPSGFSGDNPAGTQWLTHSGEALHAPHATRKSEARSKADGRGSRLPTDWALPADWARYCTDKRPDLDPESTAQDFADWYHSAPSNKGGLKTDWLKTWQRWVRNQDPPRGTARAGPPAAPSKTASGLQHILRGTRHDASTELVLDPDPRGDSYALPAELGRLPSR